MSLRFICIEIRRQLHCANVFLQFDESLTETEFLKINIEENALRLREYSTETKAEVTKYFTIEARSMSNLIIEECNASFRLSIDNIQEQEASGSNEAASSSKTEKQKSDMILQIEEKNPCQIICGNCEMILTSEEQQIFERLRDFPSGTIDVSEFFCHHGPNFSQVLAPKLNDLFYGFLFVILNYDLIQTKMKFKDNHIYCKRCLKYLGELLFDGKASKIWSDSIKCKIPPNSEELKEIFEINGKTHIELLLHKIIKEFTFTPEEHLLQQFNFTKIILQASFPNRKCKYLLMQILENNVEVLRNTKPLAHGSHNNNNILNINLESWLCFKLIYRFVDTSSSDENEDLVLFNIWQDDVNIHTFKVSHILFTDLVQELEENSLLFPEIHRYTQNDFQTSYIFYQK